ncbi:MAG: CDP-alcohol phosphatidyltransferase family protein [Alphaproteobacteria bacterium]|nr:CDP-alcohol phosphatidyltransferase family protein [Alphaproteobacteria bacterium]
MPRLTNLPNIISIARLLSVPVAVWLIVSDLYAAAFWLFMIAGLSDAVDGFLARLFNAQTPLGAYIDPLADKMLLVGVYVTLGLQGLLPDWLVILVVFRDLLIIGGALLLYTMSDRSLSMAPLWVSKINTVAQIALAGIVLARSALLFDDGGVAEILIYVVAATTFISGMGYLGRWTRGVTVDT